MSREFLSKPLYFAIKTQQVDCCNCAGGYWVLTQPAARAPRNLELMEWPYFIFFHCVKKAINVVIQMEL